jgi:hypothetical protein
MAGSGRAEILVALGVRKFIDGLGLERGGMLQIRGQTFVIAEL